MFSDRVVNSDIRCLPEAGLSVNATSFSAMIIRQDYPNEFSQNSKMKMIPNWLEIQI